MPANTEAQTPWLCVNMQRQCTSLRAVYNVLTCFHSDIPCAPSLQHPEPIVNQKHCKKCGILKYASEFCKSKWGVDGLHSR